MKPQISGFPLRVQIERTRKRLTQEQLADKVGISRYSMIKIENGIATTSISTLKELAIALECSADYLLGLTENRLAPDPSKNPSLSFKLQTIIEQVNDNTAIPYEQRNELITLLKIALKIYEQNISKESQQKNK